MNIQLLHNGINVFTVKLLYRFVDVPLNDLAIDKERCISIATPIKCRMQWSKPQFRLRYDGIPRFDFVIKQIIKATDIKYGCGRRKLTVGNHVYAIGGGVNPMRAVGNRNVACKRRVSPAINKD